MKTTQYPYSLTALVIECLLILLVYNVSKTYAADMRKWDIAVCWKKHIDNQPDLYRTVYCAYNSSLEVENYFGPLPPSFDPVVVGLFDSVTEKLHAYEIKRDFCNGGLLYTISFVNNSSIDQKVYFYLEDYSKLPLHCYAKVYNEKGKQFEVCDSTYKSTIDLPPHSEQKKIIAIGNDTFFSQALASKKTYKIRDMKAYFNRQKNCITVHLSKPLRYGMRSLFASLYNSQGKKIKTFAMNNTFLKSQNPSVDIAKQGLYGHSIGTGFYLFHLIMNTTDGEKIQWKSEMLIKR